MMDLYYDEPYYARKLLISTINKYIKQGYKIHIYIDNGKYINYAIIYKNKTYLRKEIFDGIYSGINNNHYFERMAYYLDELIFIINNSDEFINDSGYYLVFDKFSDITRRHSGICCTGKEPFHDMCINIIKGEKIEKTIPLFDYVINGGEYDNKDILSSFSLEWEGYIYYVFLGD